MQAGRGGARPPMGIALEGDFGNRIDAVLAVAMLNGLIAKMEVRRIALSVSRPSIKAAQLADVVSGFYVGRVIAGPGGGVGGNPAGMIGMPETGPAGEDPAPIVATLAKKGPDGAALYTSQVTRLLDTADNAVLIRNMLLAQNDGNATIVLAGQASGLARLLGLFGSRPQIETKCKQLMVALGGYPSGPVDPAITADVAAARTLFADWPTPLIAVGAEVGTALPYPGASIEKDFAWSPSHPVVDAYKAFKPMPYDAPAPALAAVLFAAHPELFTLSPPGTITVADDGRTQFKPDAAGRHRYLIVDPAQQAQVISLYTALVSAPPAPRPGRRGGGAPALDPAEFDADGAPN
ncbi:MAG: hypothetical protein ABI211_01340 [Vicinamibacterales bacterium]